MNSLELFAGAGGLAMGVSQAGFRHRAVVEFDHDACSTLRHNKSKEIYPVSKWPIHQTDVRHFDFSPFADEVDLVAGGPPCQPFSIGGKHRGRADERNMFPELVRAVREIRPRAILVENVKGLLRPAFSKYFQYILLQLEFPEVSPRPTETWEGHLSRLQKHKASNNAKGLHYNIEFKCLNAANFGVPQRRERVFIVGFRSDLKVNWEFPKESHSLDSLLHDQFISGAYWDRHKVARKQRPSTPTRLVKRIARLREILTTMIEEPISTVRDAISDLPPPESRAASKVSDHRLVKGARTYTGHTGSPLDEPAKTLKAGDHGVPGGENTLALPDGHVRYFTVRESARLQTFPDKYTFSSSSWSESMRQLGNAVPVLMGFVVARKVHSTLKTVV